MLQKHPFAGYVAVDPSVTILFEWAGLAGYYPPPWQPGLLFALLHALIHRSAWRDCMKSGSRRVFRYSSTHEKEIPHGSIRRRMELHRTSHASSQRIRAAQDPRSSRDPERCLLPAEERMPVAPASPRLPQVANRLLVLQEMAYRRHLGEDQPCTPRTPQDSLGQRSSTQRRRGG